MPCLVRVLLIQFAVPPVNLGFDHGFIEGETAGTLNGYEVPFDADETNYAL